MKVSHRWLSDFVALDPAVWTPSHVATTLTNLGLEVEHVDDQAAPLALFVVGHVTTRERHPKADRLSVCTVDVGDGTPRTIVCGAPNVDAGQRVAVALEGATVPNGGFRIERRTLRGVESQGMICSKAELGVGEDHDGIWVLPDDSVVGMPLAEALGRTDVVYDVAITPNRADALSHIGVARDLHAVHVLDGGVPFVADAPARPAVDTSVDPVTVRIDDADLCRRCIAIPVRGVHIGPSPAWMQQRLEAVGLRPRNVVVDITNYVMMEMGQPLHAYDARTLRGRTIVVRTAGVDQTFTTLDGKERSIAADMLMIADAEGPVGVAGVMGGQDSEIRDDTTDVILESAWFQPQSIRRTAKRLGIASDASYRFERGVDPAMVEAAVWRAAALMADLAGGTVGPATDVHPRPHEPMQVRVRFARMRAVNGIDISDDRVADIVTAVTGPAIGRDAEGITVTVPSWRGDIGGEIDFAEEVMRFHGLDAIAPSVHARIPVLAASLPAAVAADRLGPRLRRTVVDRGFMEVRTTVQTTPEAAAVTGLPTVTLRNPLGRDMSVMRTSVIPSLATVASLNLRHGARSVRLVELGKIFVADAQADLRVREHETLALLWTGRASDHWSGGERMADVYDLTGLLADVFRTERCTDVALVPDTDADHGLWSANRLAIMAGGERVGTVGQLAPSFLASYDIDGVVLAADVDVRRLRRQPGAWRPLGQFPSVTRDVAFVVAEGVPAAAVVDVVRAAGTHLLHEASIFDVYRDDRHLGAGLKSIAVAMTFRSDDRTLVDADVDAIVASIITAAHSTLQATVRGGSGA